MTSAAPVRWVFPSSVAGLLANTHLAVGLLHRRAPPVGAGGRRPAPGCPRALCRIVLVRFGRDERTSKWHCGPTERGGVIPVTLALIGAPSCPQSLLGSPPGCGDGGTSVPKSMEPSFCPLVSQDSAAGDSTATINHSFLILFVQIHHTIFTNTSSVSTIFI